ncbi:MAG: hypothetical protein ACRD41_16965 [Candidatus Acidiferrales bacterium]
MRAVIKGRNNSKSKNFPKNEKAKTKRQMNNSTQFEDRASRSRSKHEGESSSSLCDRFSRTRDFSQRQLPTDQDYAVSTREYQTDQSSPKTAPAAAGPALEKQKQPHSYAGLDRSLHIREVQCQANAYGIPLLLETHRGRLTQDVFRTAELLARLPEIAITLDVSHYIVAGETLGGSENLFREHMAPLLARSALIHGRISNGQSVQVSVEDSFAFTSLIQSLWQQAMRIWLKNAPVNAIFVFEPELGPPPYAYLDGRSMETFSRTAETRTLTQLARQAWAAAQTEVHLSPTTK